MPVSSISQTCGDTKDYGHSIECSISLYFSPKGTLKDPDIQSPRVTILVASIEPRTRGGAEGQKSAQDGQTFKDRAVARLTNVADLTPPEVVQRYEALAYIERGFGVLKSEVEIEPVYHRLPERIRAHAFVCFLADRLTQLERSACATSAISSSPISGRAKGKNG